MENGEMSTQSTYYEYEEFIGVRGLLQYQDGMSYYEDLNFPMIIVDTYGSEDPNWKRVQVRVPRVEDPTLVSEWQMMVDALPDDSPRKQSYQNVVDLIANTYDTWLNPPTWDDLP